jgi:hypothetical protein
MNNWNIFKNAWEVVDCMRYGLLAGPGEHGYIKRFDIIIRIACIDMNS